jgi:hypothetical protein
MALGLGLGIQFIRPSGGIDAQAQVHYNRVIADGGVVPSGLSGVNAFFSAVKAIYGTSDINTAISAAYDAHYLGYKLGAGSGTTLGQAAQKLYAPKGIFGGIGTGSAYWEGVGVAGNFVTTPNAAANQITGDIFMFAYVSNWTNPNAKMVIGKRGAGSTNIAYSLFINADNTIGFRISSDGNSNLNQNGSSSVVIPFTSGWIGLFRNATTGVCTFYTSTNSSTTNPTSITWSQLGTTVNTSSYNIFNANIPLSIGQYSVTSASEMFSGLIYSAGISTSVNGTPTQIFNANQYTGANTWTSTTSEVWTVNSTGAGLADVVQTTAASQPLLLAHTGENYWFGSGVDGNFVSTSNRTPAGSTQLDVRVKFEGGNLNSGRTFFSQSGAGGGETDIFVLRFANASTGTINMLFGAGLALSQTSSVGVGAIANYMGWIRVTYVSNGVTADVTFFSSTDGVTYTQLSTHTVVSARLGNQNAPYQIGSNIGFNPFQGKISRATASNTINGTPVVDFNPASYNPATSQTQWSSATDEVWSISTGTATTGYKAAVITKSIVMSDGVDDRMQAATLNINTTAVSLYSAFRKYNNTAGAAVIELGTDYSTTNGFGLYLNSLGAAAEAFGIFGNVFNARVYNSNSLLLKLSTAIGDTSIPDPETQYFINNSAQSVFATFSAANNTTGINQTGLNVFGKSGGTSLSNLNMNTLIISNTNNNLTNRTAMYDYIKSINNNAF